MHFWGQKFALAVGLSLCPADINNNAATAVK